VAKILVISPTPTHPQDAGNRSRIFSLLTALKSAGHTVNFAFVRMEGGDEQGMSKSWDGFWPIPYRQPNDRWFKRQYDMLAKRFGFEKVWPYLVDDWYTPDIDRHVSSIRDALKPDVVMVEYVFLSKVFDCFQRGVLKIIDTHDVFGNRHLTFFENDVRPQWFYTTPQEEKKALGRADVVLAIQENEAKSFASFCDAKVMTVGHLAKIQKVDPDAGDSDGLGPILFVGSANASNVEGLKWFLQEVLPLLHQQLPDVKVDIVGNCVEYFTPQEGVSFVGKVPDLAQYYRRAQVVVNPLRFGTGLKIKSIEALAYGKPLVTTSVGADGLGEGEQHAFLLADSADEFAGGIFQCLAEPALAEALSCAAIDFVQSYNKRAIQPLHELLESFRGD